MPDSIKKTITKRQWDLFVWMVDSCERKQGNCCEGCGFIEDCIALYRNVSNICMSDSREAYREHESQLPTPGNPCVELHGEDVEVVCKKVRKGLKPIRRNGVPVI